MPRTPAEKFLTTGKAAALCSVTPDTVLKWIKSGKIPANRTPGGHHRIPHSVLLRITEGRQPKTHDEPVAGSFQYCWEYNAKSGKIPEGCQECIVYRSRTRRCYKMRELPAEAGHAHLFCEGPCEECEYYRLIGGQRANVMVVTDKPELRVSLEREAKDADLNLRFADCEYRCSMMVEKYRPDYVVVDCSLGADRSRDFAQILDEDPRIPFVRVILSGNRQERPAECDKLVYAFIQRPFTASMLSDLIRGSQLKD